MLLKDVEPDTCPNCQFNGIARTLSYCPCCGWRVKSNLDQIDMLLNFVPIWLILLVCLSLSLYCGRTMTMVQSWSPESKIPINALDMWSKFMIFCAYAIPFSPVVWVILRRCAKAIKRNRSKNTVTVSYEE